MIFPCRFSDQWQKTKTKLEVNIVCSWLVTVVIKEVNVEVRTDKQVRMFVFNICSIDSCIDIALDKLLFAEFDLYTLTMILVLRCPKFNFTQIDS